MTNGKRDLERKTKIKKTIWNDDLSMSSPDKKNDGQFEFRFLMLHKKKAFVGYFLGGLFSATHNFSPNK